MDIVYDIIELLRKQLPALYDLASERNQLHVPYAQSFLQIRIHEHILQELVSLIYYFVVMI